MKCKTPMTAQMQKELNARLELGAKILIGIGCVGVVCFITDFIWNWISAKQIFTFAFVFDLLMGVLLFISVKRTNKNAIRAYADRENEYEFFEEYFTLKNRKGEEILSEAKIEYKEILKFMETKNYLFIYANPTIAYPVLKSELQAEELTSLKEYLRKGIKDRKSKK